MIVSNFDQEKFESMEVEANSSKPVMKSDQDDFGELKSFVEGVNEFKSDSGIVISVKCARHKAQEVKSVMEQSGAEEIVVDD